MYQMDAEASQLVNVSEDRSIISMETVPNQCQVIEVMSNQQETSLSQTSTHGSGYKDKPTRFNMAYTQDEDMELIEFVAKHNRYNEVKGLKLYKDAFADGVCAGRTVWSMNERMRKHVIPNISKYPISESLMDKFTHLVPDAVSSQRALAPSAGVEIVQASNAAALETDSSDKDSPVTCPGSSQLSINDCNAKESSLMFTTNDHVQDYESDEEVSFDGSRQILFESTYLEKSFYVPLRERVNFQEKPGLPLKLQFIKKPYTLEEDLSILNAVISKRLWNLVKGRSMWEDLASEDITGSKRSWQSMKERYRKHIIPNLSRYEHVSKTIACKLLENCELKAGLREEVLRSLVLPVSTTVNSYGNDSSSVDYDN